MQVRQNETKAEDYDFVPAGAATHLVPVVGKPKDYLFVLTPHLTMLALSAAIEPLRIANQLAGQMVYRWHTAGHKSQPLTCSNGMRIVPDMDLPKKLHNTYAFVCAGVEPEKNFCISTLKWLRQQERFGAKFGAICTGAHYLARAGLLNRRKFTLHWENQAGFVERYPSLKPTNRLFEVDGQVLTCGGGAATTDMMLSIIQDEHGSGFSNAVADMCLHNRRETQDSSQKSAIAALIGSRNPKLLQAIELMHENIEEPLALSVLASRVNSSRRQLERLFKKFNGTTPSKMYREIRLDHAHALLRETNLAVWEIAAATGFGSQNFSLHFREKFGVSPRNYKAS